MTSLLSAQTKFSHEKEIEHKENYNFTNVDFYNSFDGLTLSGTLITPKKPYSKIVIIIAGSGKDTRYAHHKLAEEFLKSNIAVYRFDERGVGKSEGSFTPTITGLTNDLIFSIKHFKASEKYKNIKIGVLGHSLGGMASIVAYDNSISSEIDFLIQIASPVKNFSNASKHQINNLSNYQVLNKTKKETLQLLDTLLYITKKHKNLNSTDLVLREKGIDAIENKGFQLKDIKFWSYTHINLFKQDYEAMYKMLQIPTMYLIGKKDKYVSPISEVNLLKQYNNPLITVKVMANLNHYLTSGALNPNVLYDIDKRATDEIMNWILKI